MKTLVIHWKSLQIISLATFALIFITWLGQPTHAQSPEGVDNTQGNLTHEATVRVIVVLHPVEAGAAKADQIAQSQKSVTRALNAVDFNVTQRYQTLPGMVGEVTPISGTVRLQGRPDFSGTGIFLSAEPCSSSLNTGDPTIVTDTQGRFRITPPANIAYQCLKAVQSGYLMGQKDFPQAEVGAITLPGGDVVEDSIVNILDLAFMAIHYHSSNSTADVNADGQVDIFDLTIAASNYNQRGPVINWE